MKGFGCVLTAMVTPFDDQMEVDYKKAAELAKRLVASGSDGVVVAGTTGESPTLTREEKISLFKTVTDAIGSEATVIAGTGTNATRASIELTKAAEKAGVHGIMLVVPYYNKPPQEGIYRHFEAVAKETSLPIILYNIPGRTGVNMTVDTLVRLGSIKNIVAVKESTGNLDQASEIKKRMPTDFSLYSGDDSLTLPLLSVGGVGVISVASHVAGMKIKEMINSYFAGEATKAWKLHGELFPLFKALFVTTNPIPVKAALRLAGFDAGGLRLPLVEASDREIAVIKKAMEDAGVL